MRKLLETPEGDLKAACNALAKRLPKMIPASLSMADALEEEMAKAVAGEVTQKIANSGHPYTKCPGCGKFMNPNGCCGHCGFVEDDDRLIARGKRALERATDEKMRSVEDAMFKKGLGFIDFDLGWPPKGIAKEHGNGMRKIVEKHYDDMEAMPETIVKGRITTAFRGHSGEVDTDRIYVIHSPYIATLRKKKNGRWRLTSHYRNGDQAKTFEDKAHEHAKSSKLGGR